MVARERLRERVTGGGSYFAAPKSNLEFIPTGSKLLDLCLGGGWAEERVANIVGDKSTGKTLLCIEACANFLRKYPNGLLYYREAEAAFDREYAAALGMPVKSVVFGEPLETVEDLFEDLVKVIEYATRLKRKALYILDSLDALSDRAELDRDMDEGTYGANKAKNLSQLFRRLVRKLAGAGVTVIIVSQIRSKIGDFGFGRKTTRSGGKALDFYASQVVYLQHVGQIPQTISGIKRIIGIEIKFMCDKNKISLPFRGGGFNIMFGYGIDDSASCVEWLKEAKGLKLLRLPEKEIKPYLVELQAMNDNSYRAELKDIHAAVETKWYEIETTFLPKRRKYN